MLEILQQNVKWSLLKKTVIHHDPPVDYTNLKELLTMVGMAEQYLAMAQSPTSTNKPMLKSLFIPILS